ncbi:MAG: signal peptide peptidase SppA [Thermotogae bacterium]|nr:signal peptide peptidase SppA [Thermotogota bacterium]
MTLLYPFFELSSVATAYGGNYLTNPAALAYGSRELGLFYTDSLVGGAFSFAGFGLGYLQGPSSKSLLLSSGFPLKDLSLGSTYDVLNRTFLLGALYRPLRFLSFGLVFDGEGMAIKGTSVGLAVRPIDRLVIYAQTHHTKLSLSDGDDGSLFGDLLSLGAYVYPLPYVGFKGEYALLDGARTGRLSLGLELNLSKLKVAGAYAQGMGKGFGLLLSDRPFTPSVRRGRYEIKVKSYPEDGRVGFLGKGKTFYSFLKQVKEAVESPNVKVIALDMREFALSLPQAEELRNLLKRAKERGKEVLFYSDGYSTKSYYLASVGKVFMAPEGMMYFPGMKAELTFFKRAFDSLGIDVQEFRMGKYKSAIEPFVRDTMSEANREQLNRLIEVVWGIWLKDVAEARGMDADSLNALVKENLGLFSARKAVKLGLADSLMYEDQWKALLREKGGKVRLVKVQRREWKSDRGKIAVVVAEGGIVSGESSYNPLPVVGGKTLGDRTLVRILSDLRKDESVKAVVLRVNSPGGSALASDNIAREVKLLAEDKVLIVSMGNVAASGGYYISAYADTILVDNTTITGSIGVIGAKFVLRDFYRNKLHLNRDIVKTYPFSDAWSLWREMDSSEVAFFKRHMEETYDRFVSVVSEGRKLPKDSVKAIGGGRVWAGYDAVRIGLADTVGGLLDAIELASRMAGLKEYDVVLYPKPKSTWQKVREMMGGKSSIKLSPEDYLREDVNILYRMEYDVEIR